MSDFVVVVGDKEFAFKLSSHSPAKTARQIVTDSLFHLEMMAKVNAPHQSGNLMRAISKSEVYQTSEDTYSGHVGVGPTAPYGRWVEEGTGIYGPKHQPIKSLTGNFLVWESERSTRKDGKFFTRQVKGQKPKFYMKRAYEYVTNTYLPAKIAAEADSLADI